MPWLSLLFGLRERVTRKSYVGWGVGLAVCKFVVDTGIVYAFTRRTWSPLGYVVPSVILRQEAVGGGPEGMYVLLPLVALPFLWVGLSMSVRRAADAGVSPWYGTLFVVPLVNYVAILVLSLLRSRRDAAWAPSNLSAYRSPGTERQPPPAGDAIPSGVRAALAGVLASMGVGIAMVWLCVYGVGTYGVALFFATPFAMGAANAAIYNRHHTRSLGATFGLAALGVLLTGTMTLLFAIEGLLCLAMAAPIATIVALVGALVGRAIMIAERRQGRVAAAMMLSLPGAAFGEAHWADPPLRHVTTVIDIDAPPERVWPNVIGFGDLEEPPQWFFRLGIAYPKRARISGKGVGAVRRCEFSTGAFVEPITAWVPPTRLAFDVAAAPPSMTEWSPYAHVHPPHLETGLVSKGGEFDLQRLPGRHTRLEGTTHYTLAIYPQSYWAPYAEAVLHAIHLRVLHHIKRLSERPPAP